MRPQHALVIGVGNPDRGDDGAGPAVASTLAAAQTARVGTVVRQPDPTALVEDFSEAETVYIVDASRSGTAPGTVRRFEVADAPLSPRMPPYSSHGFDLSSAIELARALGHLPRRLIVFSIEGRCFELGTGLSPPVEQAVGSVADRILDETGRQPNACRTSSSERRES